MLMNYAVWINSHLIFANMDLTQINHNMDSKYRYIAKVKYDLYY